MASRAASSSSMSSLPAARGAGHTRGVGAASARAASARGWRAARTPSCARVCVCGVAADGCGEGGAAARTPEFQLDEGLVGLERGGQLLGPLVADRIACGARGGAHARCGRGERACGERSGLAHCSPSSCRRACACGSVAGWVERGAPRHALLRSSQSRVALALSAAASSFAPLSPITLPAARGAGRTRGVGAASARAACARGWRTAHPSCTRACACAAVRRGCGEGGAAARTFEVQRGEGRVGLERGGQLLGPLVADLIVCGTRGGRTRGVGAASARAACARGWRNARPPPARVHARAAVRRAGVGRAARTSEGQRGEGRVGLERGGQLLGPLGADLIACGTRGGRTRGVGAASARAACARGWRTARPPPARVHARAAVRRGWGVGRTAPRHAPKRSSVVRVLLALSAAASSLAPSSPIALPAARGAGARAVWARRARVRRALRAGGPHALLLHACMRVRRCGGVWVGWAVRGTHPRGPAG